MKEILNAFIAALVAWAMPLLLQRLKPRPGPAPRRGNPWTPTESVGRFRWPLWLLGLAGGGALGSLASWALSTLGVDTPQEVGGWLSFGVAVGVAEWMLLRHQLGEAMKMHSLWPVACALGWSGGYYLLARDVPLVVAWVAVGAAIGVLQWVLIARCRGAGLWLPANLVAWPLGGLASQLSLRWILDYEISLPLAWAAGGAIFGLVAAVVLGLAARKIRPRALWQ